MTQRPSWIDPTEYAFRSHHFPTKDGRIHYVDEGRGVPIVMVHGNPTWSFVYRNVIRRLSPQARCIALDHLGFGLSDKPRTTDLSPQAHASRFAQFVDELGLRDVTLMVQDWGGPIGLSYALDHPENVRGLVIMNTWMWPVNGDPHYERFSGLMGGAIGQLLIKRFNFFVRGVMPRAVADPKKSLPPRIRKHYAKALPDANARRACATLPGHIMGSTEWLESLWRRRDVLSTIPTLILWGEKDIAFRAKELATWKGALPHARVHKFPSAGHYVQEEESDVVAHLVLDWLDAGPKPSTATRPAS